MIHPFFDPTTLKDNELETKRQQLTEIYYSSSNFMVKNQVTTILDIIQSELSQRRAKLLEKQYQTRDKTLDGLVKVR